MDEAISYGWAGKILRVNLTSGAISVEPTDPYKDLYIGGMGIANKILYDEVEPGTDPLSPENKIPRVANRAGPIPTLSCGNAHRS